MFIVAKRNTLLIYLLQIRLVFFPRPSSRGANSDYYPIYEDPNLAYMRGQPFVYQQMPSAEQQQPSMLDPTRLEAFRKNWEYYKMWNPQVN